MFTCMTRVKPYRPVNDLLGVISSERPRFHTSSTTYYHQRIGHLEKKKKKRRRLRIVVVHRPRRLDDVQWDMYYTHTTCAAYVQ